jgi:beta-lactamase superfamily II metal-dependent hydrolase
MPKIQVDMFEVQLGAAILLQFQVDGRPVRVLADAGIKASGYERDHVLRKLLPILDEGGDRHIHLVIGTHYDEDHLAGLVPVIEHEDITIDEAWMPPVANDTEPHALDGSLSESDLLAHQFYEGGGGARLARYVRAKRADVETLHVFEGRHELHNEQSLHGLRRSLLAWPNDEMPLQGGFENVISEDLLFLRQQLEQPEAPDERDHAVGLDVEPAPEVEEAIAWARRGPMAPEPLWLGRPFALSLDHQLDIRKRVAEVSPEAAAAQQLTFAEIGKSSAEDAINAAALYDVVSALRRKRVPIRTEIIPDGEPRRYAWRDDLRRFVPAARGGTEPILMLLGPSQGLVRKHWNRLPVEQATRVALSFIVPIKSITPSNQLSYVMRFEHAGQGMLVSGDAGCVDFKLDRTHYHPRLLQALLPLHVLQVAHHGGANGHFYRVLDAAGYADQTDHSYLLLSHATDDRHRPSEEFRLFLLATLGRGEDVQLLFTSKPKPEKVRDFVEAFHPVVGRESDRGDVRLVFNAGSFRRGRWEVASHAVAPGSG